jgi:hypothetical protein
VPDARPEGQKCAGCSDEVGTEVCTPRSGDPPRPRVAASSSLVHLVAPEVGVIATHVREVIRIRLGCHGAGCSRPVSLHELNGNVPRRIIDEQSDGSLPQAGIGHHPAGPIVINARDELRGPDKTGWCLSGRRKTEAGKQKGGAVARIGSW